MIPETAAVLNVNTLEGMCKFRRLPSGVAAALSAPAIFQQFKETTLLGIFVYLCLPGQQRRQESNQGRARKQARDGVEPYQERQPAVEP